MGDVSSIDGRSIDEVMADAAEELGRSLEDMTLTDVVETLPGTQSQMSFGYTSEFDVVESTLKIASMPAMPVNGQYTDGDVLTYTVKVQVDETTFKPVYDRHRHRVGTRRHHVARVVSVDPAEAGE